mmetsp:Transcript_70603/g.165563  ORF Transcript_70603/g.165563 Transcript_70603/m.165563 type:complete len:243 (-) Transcript_70603:88-816(-)
MMRAKTRRGAVTLVCAAAVAIWGCDWCWSQFGISGTDSIRRLSSPFEGRQLQSRREAAPKGFQAKVAKQAPKHKKTKKKKAKAAKVAAKSKVEATAPAPAPAKVEAKAPAPAPALEPEPVPEKVPEKEVEVIDPNESDEDREFRERYLSAEKEEVPDWQSAMRSAKTKEEKFKVGLRVGDLKTSYGILFEELIASFVSGDKEQFDEFLMNVGIAQWQLALIQVVVLAFPIAVITYVLGLWKF